MKAKYGQATRQFQPVELTITIETDDELTALRARIGIAWSQVKNHTPSACIEKIPTHEPVGMYILWQALRDIRQDTGFTYHGDDDNE